MKEIHRDLLSVAGKGDVVTYAEPDYAVSAIDVPNDARFGDQWGLHNTGQTGGRADGRNGGGVA